MPRTPLCWASPFHYRMALVGVPAIPLIFLLGQLAHQPLRGAIAAGAAFSVGFGASRELMGWRWGAMAAAALGMALAGLCGTLAGWTFPLLALLSGILATVCAVLALRDEDWWWVALQVVIAFMVAGYFPGDVSAAAWRAGLVLAGGGLQLAAVALLARLLFPGRVGRLSRGPVQPWPERRIVLGHGLRVALSVIASLTLAAAIHLANDYWAPLTALVVLKPGLHETSGRGFLRSAGTIGGCLAATGLAVLADGRFGPLAAGVSLAIGLAYGLQKANYAVFTAAITLAVVLLVTLGQGGALANAEHRVYATVIGCLTAIAFAALLPHRPLRPDAGPDRLGPG